MMAGVELEKAASGHEMSNQESESTHIYLYLFWTILDHGRWQVAETCSSCAASCAAEMWSHRGPNNSTTWILGL